ncbi:hypothetical protein VZC37_16425 [Gordonia sp. LSe1-13]|uniref:Uncharacterized protein n=1 Tax=Gordonia sesuvii TaxID=3116777 RepID=A0ABU7MFN3_9ACTN|nr:hypothetical protein [Gordonia sp. LSe1-13]
MSVTDLSTVQLPAAARAWVASADPATAIVEHRVTVARQWWVTELAAHGFGDAILSDSLTRGDVFSLAGHALKSPEAALVLLWNALAWGSGTKNRNNRTRVTSIAADPHAAGELLQEAMRLSRTDPESAYEMLYPRNVPAIRGLGPAFFTKVLYFAGGGAPDHPCLILDERVARSLRAAGWQSLPIKNWLPSAYRRYVDLVDRWSREYDIPRPDLIERWLFDEAGRESGQIEPISRE